MRRLILVLFCFLLCPSVFAIDLTVTEQYEQDLINRLENLHNRDKNSPPIKCLTPLVLEINFVKDKVSPKTKELLKQYSLPYGRYNYSPYAESTYNSPSGHFRLHYTIYGPDSIYHRTEDANPSNGIPDYVDRCAQIFDYVWAKEIDTLGFRQPPGDETRGGGNNLYDVYIYDLDRIWGPGAYSMTESDSESFPWWSYTSFIHLNSSYVYPEYGYPEERQYDLMGVTAGHEFFHAIEFGYDLFEGFDPYPNWRPYWMEMSSTWMEDQTFDSVNDYIGYLPSFFDFPNWSLKTFSGDFDYHPDEAYHCYGSCVFPIYLSEKFGVDIMRRIWEKCGKAPFSDVWGAVASITGDLGEAFRDFTVWNFFTADRADTANYYSEGNLWYINGNPIQIKTDWCPYLFHPADSYPVEVDSVYKPCQAQGLAADYIFFETDPDRVGGLRIGFNEQSNSSWKGSVIGYGGDSVLVDTLIVLRGRQDGEAQVINWNRFKQIILIPAFFEGDTLGFDFAYDAAYDSTLDSIRSPDIVKILQTLPNPFIIENEESFVSFPIILNGPSYVEINVFTAAGELVKKVFRGNLDLGNNDYSSRPGASPGLIDALTWNGKNEDGEIVASGIYLYEVKTKDTKTIKKMAVIRK